jgi:hypothetical protein
VVTLSAVIEAALPCPERTCIASDPAHDVNRLLMPAAQGMPVRSAAARAVAKGISRARTTAGTEKARLLGGGMSVASSREAQSLVVNGTRIDFVEKGSGPPLLYLHAENGIEPAASAIDELAKSARVIAPTHPGYGRSELPKGMRSVDDLSYFYLDLLDQLDL